MPFFRQRYPADVVHSGRVYHTFRTDSRGKSHRHRTARPPVVTVAERLVQRAEVCFIDIAHRIDRIQDLILPLVDFLSQIVVKIRRANLNDIFSVIRHRGVDLELFLRYGTHFREEGSGKRKNALKIERKSRECKTELKESGKEPWKEKLERCNRL